MAITVEMTETATATVIVAISVETTATTSATVSVARELRR
jgi:hypothetical protein